MHLRNAFASLMKRAYALLMIAVALGGISAQAEEVPPLHTDKKTADALLSALSISYEFSFRLPGLGTSSSFNAISPEVLGVDSLARFGLAKEGIDQVALLNFVRGAIATRLQELGASNEIRTKYDPSSFGHRDIDCDLLRLMFAFEASEVEVSGSRAVAVVVELLAWQDGRALQRDQTVACLDKRYAPWMRRDARKVLVFQAGDRDGALAQFREALLSMIDSAVLLRIIASNERALQTVRSWPIHRTE